MVWCFSTCLKLYTLFFISALERTQGKKHFLTALDYSPVPKFCYPLVLKGIISWFVSYNM